MRGSPEAGLGMRLLGSVESEMQAAGLVNESGFRFEADMPVAHDVVDTDTPVDRLAVGDSRFLGTLPTRTVVVEGGIDERVIERTSRDGKNTHASIARTAFVLVSRPAGEDPDETVGLGTFETYVNRSGSKTAIDMPLAGETLESVGVEIDLDTGRGRIIGLRPGESEFTRGASFDAHSFGESVVHEARDQHTGEPRAVVDEYVKTATLALDFFTEVVRFARERGRIPEPASESVVDIAAGSGSAAKGQEPLEIAS